MVFSASGRKKLFKCKLGTAIIQEPYWNFIVGKSHNEKNKQLAILVENSMNWINCLLYLLSACYLADRCR